jgi:hypothetical protein
MNREVQLLLGISFLNENFNQLAVTSFMNFCIFEGLFLLFVPGVSKAGDLESSAFWTRSTVNQNKKYIYHPLEYFLRLPYSPFTFLHIKKKVKK